MRRRRSGSVFAAALTYFTAAAPALAAEDIQTLYDKLQPYRAVYDLRPVAKAGAGASFSIAPARLTTEARIGCKDIELVSVMSLSVPDRGGRTAGIIVEDKVQESRDGRNFRRISRIVDNGREVRRHEAHAVLQTREGPGKGFVTRGAPETLNLERGTILSGTHALRAVAAASGTVVRSRVFVGEDYIRLADITTTMLGAGTAPANAALGEFAGKPGRTMRDVIRGVGPNTAGRERASDSFVTDDGVVISMSLSVRGIEFAGTALKIEKLPKPACP